MRKIEKIMIDPKKASLEKEPATIHGDFLLGERDEI